MNKPKYLPIESARFKRGVKLALKQGKDLGLLEFAVDQLSRDIPLPINWKDHKLTGDMSGHRECHLDGASDWLLVYQKRDDIMILYLYGVGSHEDVL